MSWGDALLPRQEPTAIPISWQDGGQTAVESKKKEKAGLYTPNNRCRPEAPLTSLPKLTPVKNVEEDSWGRGKGRKEG